MQSDVASAHKVASLRSFAGTGVPDARLRAALVRAGGDLNLAATSLLADGAMGRQDAPIQVAAAQSQSQRAPPPKQQPKTDLSHQNVRRLAWRQFYRENYPAAVAAVGTEKKAIDAFITGLWKAVGSAKREEYTKAIKAQLEAEMDLKAEEPMPESTAVAVGTASSALSARDEKQNSAALRSQAVEVSVATAKPLARGSDKVGFVVTDRKEEAVESSPALAPRPPPAKRMRHHPPERIESERQNPVPQVTRLSPQAAVKSEWPKKIASRLCTGFMLASGKKNILSAGDEVILEPSQPPRNGTGLSGRGKRGNTSLVGQSRIVRFVKKGRELGRLGADVAASLGPALQSGFVVTTGKVIVAPRVAKIHAEVILDVSVYITKEAFAGKADQDAAECGVSVLDSSAKGENVANDKGVDARRVNVINLISTLNLCEPPEKPEVDFPMGRALQEDEDAGTIPEEHAEAYYRTVDEIDKGAANSFTPPKHLSCTLREYQRAGVGWMVARENFGSCADAGEANVDFMLNPLWKKRVFPDGGVFFMNPTTGGLSIDAPLENAGGPYGGILADEMGLGKTVQCIACIVHDLEQQKDEKGTNIRELSIDRSGSASPSFSTEPNHALQTDGGRYQEHESGEDARMDVDSDEEKDEITPVKPGGEEVGQKQPTGADKLAGKDSRSTPRRSTRSIMRTAPNYEEESNKDTHKRSGEGEEEEKTDNDWDEDSAEDETAKQTAQTEDDSEDDWFESPRKWKQTEKRKPRPKSRKESAFDKLMAAAHAGNSDAGGTLIVCPTSLVTQWMNELHHHVAPNFLRAVTHYGQSRGNSMSISLQCADVVVTTYGIIASECPDDPTERNEESCARMQGGPVFHLKWHRVILDEAHTIKSRTTKWARAAYRLKSERRWCVTGTVIHNHVNDVFSLLHFLRVKPWSSWAFWNRGIVSNIESKDVGAQKMAMSLLRDIISSMTLRRKKSTKDTQGRCIVHLPKKTVEIVSIVPSAEERDFYSALHDRTKTQFDTFVRQGKVMNNFASILELLLRLRQACDHPYIVFAAAPSKDSVVMKDKDKLFQQFLRAGSSSQYVEKVFNDAESGALHESKECPVCLDVIDDAVAPRECGHPACRSCLLESLQRSKRCPVCRVDVSSDSIATLPRATRFSVDLKKNWRSSAKIDELLKDLREIQSRRMQNEGQSVGKTVVFSQFTSMLDLVGMALDRKKIKSLRIDGSVPQAQRATILERFEKDDEMSSSTSNVLLVSLRAGGFGLNLCAASHAILLDIHWNPQVDAQAQDRVHRHGQTRDVIIKRYLVNGSVEERLLQVQERKQDIADGALGVATDEDKKQARLTELKLLFAET